MKGEHGNQGDNVVDDLLDILLAKCGGILALCDLL